MLTLPLRARPDGQWPAKTALFQMPTSLAIMYVRMLWRRVWYRAFRVIHATIVLFGSGTTVAVATQPGASKATSAERS